MKPRVLFVVLPYVVKDISADRPKLRSFHAFPLGLLSVATFNKDLADITILDMNSEPYPLAKLVFTLHVVKPSIVGFSMMFDNSYRYLQSALLQVKMYDPKALTILGGAAATYSYREILEEQPALDYICYSEGELPFRELLLGILSPSLMFKGKCPPPHITYIPDLNATIDLDYSLVDVHAYDMQEAFSPFVDHTQKHRQFFIVTSRGCPFKCRFCSNSSIHGRKMRFADVDLIIRHVGKLVDRYQMDVLTIYDDQLLIKKARAKELFRKLAPFHLRIEMPNGLSPAFIDREMAHYMRAAGVDTAYLAIEHGNERVLRDIIRKPLRLKWVKPAVEALQMEGIFVHGFFVIGMPGETREDRLETVQFIKDIGLDWAGLNPATPVRGSDLYRQCLERGWIKKQRIDEIEDKRYIINAPEIGLTPDIIEKEIVEMNLDVNFHNNHRMKLGDYKTAAACFEEVIRRYSGHKWANHYLKICQERMGDERHKSIH